MAFCAVRVKATVAGAVVTESKVDSKGGLEDFYYPTYIWESNKKKSLVGEP